MKQYEYRLTKYLGVLEKGHTNVRIQAEDYSLQKWHPCYMDYLQKDGRMTQRAAPAYSDQMEDQDGTAWNDTGPTFNANKPRYSEADEQFFMAYDAPTRYANDLSPMERIK